MLDPKLMAWIKDCRQFNHTDDQIKQLLVQKGYKPEDIEVYFIPENVLKKIESYGTTYKYTFYAYSGIFALSCLVLTYLLMSNLVFMVIPFGWVGVVGYFLYKNDLSKSIFSMTTLYLVLLGLTPAVLIPMQLIIIVLGSGLVGFGTWYLYSKTMDIAESLKPAWNLSLILAITLALVTLAFEIQGFLDSEMIVGMHFFDLETMTDPFIGGIMSMVLFSSPFGYFYYISKDKKLSRIIWFLMPVGMFIVASLMIQYMASYVVEMLTVVAV